MRLLNFTANKYYSMSDEDLTNEASKWKIMSYGNSNGTVERQIIIDALLKKDNANNSRFAIIISIVALVASIIGIFIN